MAEIEELARQIAGLPPSEQERLLEQVAALTLQRGLTALAQTYRERLRLQGTLHESVEATWQALRKVRGEVAARDYPN